MNDTHFKFCWHDMIWYEILCALNGCQKKGQGITDLITLSVSSPSLIAKRRHSTLFELGSVLRIRFIRGSLESLPGLSADTSFSHITIIAYSYMVINASSQALVAAGYYCNCLEIIEY